MADCMNTDEVVTYLVVTLVPIAMVYVGFKLKRRDWRITRNGK